MGVFDAIPGDGESITAGELAGNLGVEKELLGEFRTFFLERNPLRGLGY